MINEKVDPFSTYDCTLKLLLGPNNPINYLQKLSPNPIPFALEFVFVENVANG